MTTGNPTTPRDRSRRRQRSTDADKLGGRAQIIEAALQSILEVGFYRSSTNEIARRANLSWGALQYHFGTREALFLEVVKELDRRFLEGIEHAQIEGDTKEERITSLYAILCRQYDSPEFLVRLQIVLNLQHDPDTSADVRAEVTEHAARASRPVLRLLRQAIGAQPSKVAVDTLFHALRGFALSRQFARSIPVEGSRVAGPDAVKLFLHGLAIAEGAPAPKQR